MMKRRTAHSLIFLATLILLAHAVLPHHHHLLQFCIEDSHCHHHEAADPFDNDHSHDSESSANCILKELLILPATPHKLECNYTELSKGPFLPHAWLTAELQHDFQLFKDLEAREIEFSSHAPTYSLLLSYSSFLRAPPAV